MTKTVRPRYTLEFKQEAVRLVQSGQSKAAVSRSRLNDDALLVHSRAIHAESKGNYGWPEAFLCG